MAACIAAKGRGRADDKSPIVISCSRERERGRAKKISEEEWLTTDRIEQLSKVVKLWSRERKPASPSSQSFHPFPPSLPFRTGQLVAEYYLRTYGAPSSSFNWAIAGRNQNKLQEIKKDLTTNKGLPEAKDIKTLIADSDDSASLEAIAKKTKVVVTTVGPYIKYGSKLVAACAAKGTHYADLTGEVREGGREGEAGL